MLLRVACGALMALGAVVATPRLNAQTVISGNYNGTVIPGDVVMLTNTTATFTGGAIFTGANANLNDYAYFYWNQDGTLAGKTFTMGSGAYSVLQVGSGNSLTLDAATSLTGDAYLQGVSGATIINQGVITETYGSANLYAPTFTNQGAINIDANTHLNIGYNDGEILTNAAGGTITADGGGAIAYLHTLVNQGTITAQNGGTIYFTGSNVTSDLGNVQIGTGGGHAYLNNILDNTSATLTAPTGGPYELFGGTINNGTIAAGALTFTSSNGTLSNVTYTGDLTMASGTALTGSNANLADYAYFYWNQNGTLAGKTFTMGSGAYSVFQVGVGNSLTLDSATSLTGDFNLQGAAGATIINQGAITETYGASTIYSSTFINQGAITVDANTHLNLGYNGGETLTNAVGGTITADGAGAAAYLHTLVNQGTITAQNGGAVYFYGSNVTSDLGNVQIGTGGGHAYLNGTLDNTSAVLNAPTGGIYELYGGTILNGTIGNGALTFTGASGTLSNVTYLGDLSMPGGTSLTLTNGTTFTGSNASLADYAYLYWNQNGILAGKSITMGSGAYSVIQVGSGNSLTLDSATSVTGGLYLQGVAGATIINQGTITETYGTGYVYAPTLINQGAMTVDANAHLNVGYNSGETLTNAVGGTITADGAGAAAYLHTLVNQGTITAQNGGAVYFYGSNVTSDLGNVQIGTGGGHAYLNGTLDNTSATLNAPTGGVYELLTGTINNGTIGNGALTFTGSGGTLSNVTYTGDLTMPGGSVVVFTNGTTFTGSNANLGAYAYLYWDQNGTLAGKSLSMGVAGAYAVLTVGNGNSLTLDNATTLGGSIYLEGNSGATIVNQGSINQTVSTGYVFAPTFTNQGAMTAAAGTTLNIGYNNGEANTNAAGGTITADSASVYLHGLVNQGTVTAQNGGAVYFTGSNVTSDLGNVQIGPGGGHAYLTGALDNTSATLSAPTGGTYELQGGTINSGTIGAGALTFTGSNGTLSNVTYTGDLNMPGSSSATFTNGSAFTGSNASLGDYAYLFWNQDGALGGKTFTMGASAGYGVFAVGNNTVTIDSASTFTGDSYIYGAAGATIVNQGTINQTNGVGQLYAPSFVNQGAINVTGAGLLYVGNSGPGQVFSNTAGSSITVNGGTANLQSALTNNGALDVQSGNFITNGLLTNGVTGTITGSGTLSGALTLAGGTLSPGNALGTLTIVNGTLTVTAPSILQLDLSGGAADQIQFQNPTGVIVLGNGLLTPSLTLLSAPTPQTIYNLMLITSGTGSFSGYLGGLPSTGSTIEATYGGVPYDFTVSYLANTISFESVPESDTVTLLAAGGLFMAAWGWWRRKRAR
jgi:hypothetical protein